MCFFRRELTKMHQILLVGFFRALRHLREKPNIKFEKPVYFAFSTMGARCFPIHFNASQLPTFKKYTFDR